MKGLRIWLKENWMVGLIFDFRKRWEYFTKMQNSIFVKSFEQLLRKYCKIMENVL